jgi:DNA/RNA-binding domain of Phe-tRNA-synthetase-like protein
MNIAPELQGIVRLGLLEFDNIQVRDTPAALKAMIEDLAANVEARYRDTAPADIPAVKAVRAIFHKTGVDPTRYRPSSESLLRRVAKGKGLYFINSAVDVVNYMSLTTLLPMGLFNRDLIKPPVEFRAGRAGETYEGVGRDILNLTGFPLVADADGPFGSAVSDSVRTRVTEAATRLLWVIFAPPDTGLAIDECTALMVRFNGGTLQSATQL